MRAERADLVVVGAGPAGLTAAAEAARAGACVIVVDESPVPGGCLRFELQESADSGGGTEWRSGLEEARHLTDAATHAGVRVLSGASVWGLFPGWEAYLNPVDPAHDSLVPDVIRAPAVIVATGAAQKPMALPGWTLTGVLSAGAAQTLLNVHRVRPGVRAVVVGVDILGCVAARQLAFGGAEVEAILPPAPSPYTIGSFEPDALTRSFEDGLPIWDIPLLLHRAVTAVEGKDRVEGVRVAHLDASGRVVADSAETWAVDTVVTSAGLFPLVNLVQAAGCPIVHVPELGGHVPLYGADLETPLQGLFVAGSLTGIVGAPVAAALGRLAGITAARYLGKLREDRAAAERDHARVALTAARAQSLTLLPDTDQGIRRMAGFWRDRGQ